MPSRPNETQRRRPEWNLVAPTAAQPEEADDTASPADEGLANSPKSPVRMAQGREHTRGAKAQRSETYRRQGLKHFNQQRFDLALRDLERYVETTEDAAISPTIHRNIAESYNRTNQTQRAIKAYNRLLAKYPRYNNRSAVLLEVALLQANQGNLDTARTLLREASKDKAVAGRAQRQLSAINKKLAARAKAQKTKAKASRKKPMRKKAAKSKSSAAPAPAKQAPAK